MKRNYVQYNAPKMVHLHYPTRAEPNRNRVENRAARAGSGTQRPRRHHIIGLDY